MTTTKGHAEIIGLHLIAFRHLNRRDSIGDGAFRNDTHGCRRQCEDSVASAVQEKCPLRVSRKPRPVDPAKLMDENKYNADLKY